MNDFPSTGSRSFKFPPLAKVLPLAYALLDQAVVSGASFLFAVLVVRRGGLDDFGYFSLAMAALTLATNVHVALITNPMTVFLPEHADGEARGYLRRLRRAHRWIIVPLLLITLAFLGTDYRWLAVLTAIAAAASMGAEYHRKLCFAARHTSRALLIDAIGYAPLLAAWFIPWPHDEDGRCLAMAVIAAAAFLRWMLGSRLTAERHAHGNAAPWPEVARRHVGYGRWGLGQTIAAWMGGQAYPFLVAAYVGIEGSGAMNACLKIVGVANVFLWGLELFLLPRLRKTFLEESPSRFESRMRWCGIGLLAVVGALMLPCFLAPGLLLRAIYGEAAALSAQALLPIYAASYLLLALEIVFTLGLSSTKSPKAGFIGHAITAFVTVCAGPWIVSEYGILGATWALLGNAGLRCLVMGWAFLSLIRARRSAAGHPAIEA